MGSKKRPVPAKPWNVEQTCLEIERVFEKLEAKGADLTNDFLEPQSARAIAFIEEQLAIKVPDDIRSFLTRGIKGRSGCFEEDGAFSSIGFDWLDAQKIVTTTRMLRDIAGDDESEHSCVVSNGLVLTSSEPQIVVNESGVYHFSFRNDVLRVGECFGTFLHDWLASGCFCSHDFTLHWNHMKQHVSVHVPLQRNTWVKAYKQQFPSLQS